MQYGKFIEVTGEDTKELLFLARAIFKGSNEGDVGYVKVALKYIYLQKGEYEGDLTGVASDGHRLHLTSLSSELVVRLGLHEGYWRVLKNKEKRKKKVIWLINIDEPENGRVFPDFKKVIPSGEPKYKTTFETLDFSNQGSYYTKLAVFLHDLPDVTAMNIDYLLDFGSGSWEVSWYEQSKAIKFTNGDRLCLVMPRQIDCI